MNQILDNASRRLILKDIGFVEMKKAIDKAMESPVDNCYLDYVDGYLTCTYNHKAGEECLMDEKV